VTPAAVPPGSGDQATFAGVRLWVLHRPVGVSRVTRP